MKFKNNTRKLYIYYIQCKNFWNLLFKKCLIIIKLEGKQGFCFVYYFIIDWLICEIKIFKMNTKTKTHNKLFYFYEYFKLEFILKMIILAMPWWSLTRNERWSFIYSPQLTSSRILQRLKNRTREKPPLTRVTILLLR